MQSNIIGHQQRPSPPPTPYLGQAVQPLYVAPEHTQVKDPRGRGGEGRDPGHLAVQLPPSLHRAWGGTGGEMGGWVDDGWMMNGWTDDRRIMGG